MGQALYRKYRPHSFAEVVGQDHIATTLSNALKTGRISHAYLFTGPRGVGKTSVARILAKAVNGLKPDDHRQHLDIIEIDAASNRRIDEIRDLRQKVHSAPASSKYKVYIIDEVHMLTKEAFNALLKTLEEPPAHVIFILATTEAHKLPETIISRTQRFNFRPITIEDTVEHLRGIAQKEEISISDEALQAIAEHGNGSFRDSVSLLDQASSLAGRIDIDQIRNLLGLAPSEVILALIKIVASGTPRQLLGELESIKQKGYQASLLAKQLVNALRQELLDDQPELTFSQIKSLMSKLVEVPASSDPDTALEIVLLEAILKNGVDQVTKPSPVPHEINEPLPTPQIKTTANRPEPEPAAVVEDPAGNELWPQALGSIKQRYPSLYAALRMAAIKRQNDNLIVTFRFPFHKKRAEEAKNLNMLTETIHQISPDTKLILELDTDTQLSQTEPSDVPNEALDTVTNIFGGGEVLES